MEIQINLQKDDWKLFQSYIGKALLKQRKSGLGGALANIVAWMGLTLIFMIIFNDFNHFQIALVVMLFVILFALFRFNVSKIRKCFEPREDGVFCGSHIFTFSSEGIATKGKGYESRHSWEIVKKIERASGMILIYLDTAYAYVFPESKLDNPDEFYNYISEQYSNATKILKN